MTDPHRLGRGGVVDNHHEQLTRSGPVAVQGLLAEAAEVGGDPGVGAIEPADVDVGAGDLGVLAGLGELAGAAGDEPHVCGVVLQLEQALAFGGHAADPHRLAVEEEREAGERGHRRHLAGDAGRRPQHLRGEDRTARPRRGEGEEGDGSSKRLSHAGSGHTSLRRPTRQRTTPSNRKTITPTIWPLVPWWRNADRPTESSASWMMPRPKRMA